MDPDRMEIRAQRQGCQTLSGLPLLVGGVFILAASIGVLRVEVMPPKWAALPFGAMAAAAGYVIAFGSRTVTINRADFLVSSWWGAAFPLRIKYDSLEDFSEVAVEKLADPRESNIVTFYLNLEGKGEDGDPAVLELGETMNETEAERVAEEIAEFLGFPVRYR